MRKIQTVQTQETLQLVSGTESRLFSLIDYGEYLHRLGLFRVDY